MGRQALALLLSLSGIGVAAEAATFTVDSLIDDGFATDLTPGDGICADEVGACTLRAALEESNSLAGDDVIRFAVAGGIQVDSGQGRLPFVLDEVLIDGYSAPGYPDPTGADNLQQGLPRVFIDGRRLTGNIDGLTFRDGSADSRIRGVGVVRFPRHGISVQLGADRVRIEGCYVGVDGSGDPAGNAGFGIIVSLASGVVIGQRDAVGITGLGNLVGANGDDGISILAGETEVRGNIIGWSSFDISDANGGYGVRASGSNIRIGSSNVLTDEAGGNVINGNAEGGIFLSGTDNSVVNNAIGSLSLTTNEAPPGVPLTPVNPGNGITVVGSGHQIGAETGADKGNRIFAHDDNGIQVGTDSAAGDSITIAQNDIGGTAGNGGYGVHVVDGDFVRLIGNRIYNSGVEGARLAGDKGVITGNLFGLFLETQTGTPAAVPNQENGLVILGDQNLIGGSEPSERNVFGYNGTDTFNHHQIVITGADNTVRNAYVGVTPDGDAVGGAADGITVQGVGNVLRNVVVGNQRWGVTIFEDDTTIDASRIGTDDAGRSHGNRESGVRIVGGATMGTTISESIIAYNALSGVGVASGSGHRFPETTFHDNGGLAIDLERDGPTANDAGDGDSGVNRLQNTPDISSVMVDETASVPTVRVQYRVDTDAANAAYPLNLEFYLADSDTSGEGRRFLGQQSYTSANSVRTATVPTAGAGSGFIVATATDSDGNSSEFSAPVAFADGDLIFIDGFERP